MERDIFQRVQLGVPLTAAEKLRAICSPLAAWITHLDERLVTCEDGLAERIDVDFTRGRNFQSIAELIYCCHGIPEQLVPSAPKLKAWLSHSVMPSPLFQQTISAVLAEFWHLADTKQMDMAFKKIKQRVAPIEFVFIGVLLFIMVRCSRDQRALEIHKMRVAIREQFPGIHARSDIVKALWALVVKVSVKYKTGFSFNKPNSAPTKKIGKQRGREMESDEEEVIRPSAWRYEEDGSDFEE